MLSNSWGERQGYRLLLLVLLFNFYWRPGKRCVSCSPTVNLAGPLGVKPRLRSSVTAERAQVTMTLTQEVIGFIIGNAPQVRLYVPLPTR